MSAYRYYVGLHRDGREVMDPRTAARAIGRWLTRAGVASGCTIVAGEGWFRGTHERALIVYASGVSDDDHERLLTWLCDTFEQRAVGVELTPALTFFEAKAGARATKDAG